MDAIALLRQDHDEVLAMLDELEHEADSTDPAARKEKLTELVIAESRHESVEEQFFWPAVRAAVPDGVRLAGDAVTQEVAAKEVLAELERLNPDDPRFAGLLRQFITDARAHIRYEQDQVWPELTARLGTDELARLGEQMAKAKKSAPTRPHPHGPTDPGLLKATTPIMAVMDKIRDVTTGRGR